MFLAKTEIEKNSPLCYFVDEGFIYLHTCNCGQHIGYAKKDFLKGEQVELISQKI